MIQLAAIYFNRLYDLSVWIFEFVAEWYIAVCRTVEFEENLYLAQGACWIRECIGNGSLRFMAVWTTFLLSTMRLPVSSPLQINKLHVIELKPKCSKEVYTSVLF